MRGSFPGVFRLKLDKRAELKERENKPDVLTGTAGPFIERANYRAQMEVGKTASGKYLTNTMLPLIPCWKSWLTV